MEPTTRDARSRRPGRTAPGTLVVNAYGQTDGGRRRSQNQDHFLIASLHRELEVLQTSLGEGARAHLESRFHGWVLMVADGTGGHAGGDQASALVVESSLGYLRTTMPWFLSLGPDQVEVAEEALRSVVRRCHEDVLATAQGSPDRHQGTGTTLTLAYVVWPQLFVVHAGDSRCYLIRSGGMRQLTRDHTVAQDLVDHAGLPPVEAGTSQHANPLTKVVGGSEQAALEPDVYRCRLEEGDTLLLCTDGLTGKVDDGTMLRLVLGEGFANARCQALVAAANDAGGRDNITVVVASFTRRS